MALAKDEYGAEGSRTPDLFNAIEALSQLSYSPTAATWESDIFIAPMRLARRADAIAFSNCTVASRLDGCAALPPIARFTTMYRR